MDISSKSIYSSINIVVYLDNLLRKRKVVTKLPRCRLVYQTNHPDINLAVMWGGGLFPDLGHNLSKLGIKGKLIQKDANAAYAALFPNINLAD